MTKTKEKLTVGMTTLQKIKAIDDEMLKKISELHSLMTQGGLQESAMMLTKCADVLTTQSGINFNDNCKEIYNAQHHRVIPCTVNLPNNSKLEETIYKSAMPKRRSGSSEDEFMLNSSKEILGIDKQVEFLIADGRKMVQQKERMEEEMQSQQDQDIQDIEVGEIQHDNRVMNNRGQSPEPSTSKEPQQSKPVTAAQGQQILTPEEKVQVMI